MPELVAGDLLLRAWAVGDVDVVREAAGDPYIPLITSVPPEYSEKEGVAFVERQWLRATSGAGYSFVIVGERPVGQIGLWPRGDGTATIGYWVAPPARGKGVARTALPAIRDWGFEVVGLTRLELHVEPWNAASVRTAEGAGFRRDGVLSREIGGESREMLVYARSHI